MEITKLIEAIKLEDKSLFKKLVEEGPVGSISSLSEIIGNRTYFTIDEEGTIKRKGLNYALVLAAFNENMSELADQLYDLATPTEREKHKTIERLSQEEVGKLLKNYFKIMANNNVDYAKRYSKELYLKDKDLFFKKLFAYCLMEDIDSQKTLVALALRELLKEEYNDNVLNTAISYIAGVKSDLRTYEDATLKNTSKQVIMESVKTLGKTKEELNLLAYLRVLDAYDYSNEGYFVKMAEDKLEEISKNESKTKLNSFEEVIIKAL